MPPSLVLPPSRAGAALEASEGLGAAFSDLQPPKSPKTTDRTAGAKAPKMPRRVRPSSRACDRRIDLKTPSRNFSWTERRASARVLLTSYHDAAVWRKILAHWTSAVSVDGG